MHGSKQRICQDLLAIIASELNPCRSSGETKKGSANIYMMVGAHRLTDLAAIGVIDYLVVLPFHLVTWGHRLSSSGSLTRPRSLSEATS